MERVQHVIHQGHGDYEWGRHLDNSIWALIGGVLLMLFGLTGFFTGNFGIGLLFILVGFIIFTFGKRGRAKSEEYYKRKNNAPITRISYD
jgi:hypothetical protein